MVDPYAVFGNPVGHSKSPFIHARFADQTGQAMRYEAILAPLDGFARAVAEFAAAAGRGANVTVPFKEEAFRLCTRLTPRAERAGAVNTLVFDEHGILGDNTDGAGLVRDIEGNLGVQLTGKRLALFGAGGAARGALAPLLACRPSSLTIANLSVAKAEELAAAVADLGSVAVGDYNALAGESFDVLINATSASLAGASLPLPAGICAPGCLAYDMMYGKGETPFLAQARTLGAGRLADGLGMLVEQAAESFQLWRGVCPATVPVLAELRAALAAA